MKMFRYFLLFYGLLFLLVGIFGFIPWAISEDELLWDVFQVNPFLNILHILAGSVAWFVFFMKKKVIRLYYQSCGILFAAIALIGFAHDFGFIGFFSSNPATTWFHMIMGIMGLILGFRSGKVI